MLDRIEELLRVREFSSSQFADAIGVSRPVVSHILSGRNKPSLEVVQKIIAAFPDLSLNWLLNATGPMLERPAVPSPGQSEAVPKPTPRPQPGSNPTPAVAPAPSAAPVPALATAPVAEPAPPATAMPSTASVAASVAASAPASVITPAPVPAVASASVSEPQPAGPTTTPAPLMPAGAEMAYALAEPGKAIRRIVLFYQDGTFADFRPEAGL